MKKIICLLLFVSLLAPFASAELLVTANNLGQGKWGGLLSYMSNSNYLNTTAFGLTAIGGYVGYGIIDQLDLLVQLGSLNATGLPAGYTQTGTAIGGFLKYGVLKESKDMPVSVALGTGYKSISTNTTGVGAPGAQSIAQILYGAGVSKVIAPFVPYAGVIFSNSATDNVQAMYQMDITVGTAIAWSEQGAVFVEYTSQGITPRGGTNYSSGQFAGAVAYKFN